MIELIREELASGTPSNRIVVAGFSQGWHELHPISLSLTTAAGAAVALYTAYHLDVQLAGVVALSGYLPDYDRFPSVIGLSMGIRINTF